MVERMPDDWREAIRGRIREADQSALDRLLDDEAGDGFKVYPPAGQVF